MKRILYSLLAVAALGLAAGCQREPSVGEEGPGVDVAFNVSLQGLQTKAFSDGTQAQDLYVAVYAQRTGGPVYLENISTDQAGAFANGLTATVTLRLVRGESYDIAFWAQAPNAPYTLDKAAGTLTVATEGKANDEFRDAFYGVWSGTPAATTQEVTLRRPFAQINVLTTAADWAALEASQIPFAGSSMKFTAPTVLKLTTGEVETPEEYNFTFNAIDPDAVDITGYDGYKYVAMNYVLAGDRLTEKLNFSIYRAAGESLGDFEVVNVPYQRNYRTIVWGDIFTIEGAFNVTIVPDYEGSDELSMSSTTHAPGTPLYTVEFGDMEHGTVSLATQTNGFAAGETVTLNVVPDDNYELNEETLTYNTEGVDDRVPITKDATGVYSFKMPAGNITVYARFEKK